jgi:hypothetical protein
MPACDRCRAQGIECVYRPTKRARVSTKGGVGSGGRDSPQSHDDDSHRDDGHGDSDSGFPDMMGDAMGDGHAGGFGNDAYVSDSFLPWNTFPAPCADRVAVPSRTKLSTIS